jgi:hypothetical protein
MSETSIKISLEVADKAAQKALQDFISKSDAADKTMGKFGKSGSDAFSQISVHLGKSIGLFDIFAGNLAANVAIKAIDALASAAGLLFDTFATQGVQAAAEQEEAQNALNFALAQTGQYSVKAAKDFQEFAAELQSTTGVQDEVITKNAALIQSLAQLDQNGLKAATKAALDFSAATGRDLTSASEAIAKAANGNVTALQKLGIEIQKGTSDAETFKNTLKALEDQFGGEAASKVNTYSGSVQLVKAAFGELQESVGETVVKNNVVIETLKAVSSVFLQASQSINGQSSALKELVGQGVILAIQSLNALVFTADLVGRAFDVLYNIMFSGAKLMGTVFGAMTLALEGNFSGAVDAIKNGVSDIVSGIGEAAYGETVLGNISSNLFEIENAAEKGFTALGTGASTSVEPVNNLKTSITELTEEQKKANQELVNFVNNLAKQNEDGQALLDARLESLRLAREQEKLSDEEYYAQKAEAEQAFYDSQQTRIDDARNRGLVSQEQADKAQLGLEDKRTKAQVKNEVELTKAKEREEKVREENLKSSFGYISSLMQSSNREFFEIGRAAALATAYIDAQAAVMKALASAPPPFNFALAAAVGLAAAVNIGRIASAQPPSFEQGGIVPGASFSGDNVQANVNSGEMILNRSQQTELFRLANGAGGSANLAEVMRAGFAALMAKDENIVVNIGSKTVVDVLRSELNAGRSFA